jgi:hypothetical protein
LFSIDIKSNVFLSESNEINSVVSFKRNQVFYMNLNRKRQGFLLLHKYCVACVCAVTKRFYMGDLTFELYSINYIRAFEGEKKSVSIPIFFNFNFNFKHFIQKYNLHLNPKGQ